MRRATIELRKDTVKIDIEVELRVKQSVAPHQTIDLTPIGEYVELSISMLGWERRGKRWHESVGGQGRDYVLEHFGAGSKPSPERLALYELCVLWDWWHLNGLQAGSRAQRKALWDRDDRREFGYDSVYLTVLGLNPDPSGYQYGSAWLVETIPDNVIAEIETLVAELGGKFMEDANVNVA